MAKNGLFRKTIKRANVQQILKPITTQSIAVSPPVVNIPITATFTQTLISTLAAATGHLTLLPRTGILSKFLSNVSLSALGSISGINYDTSIGNGVDINGFASLPLRPTFATRYFVNISTGSDLNPGTIAAPLKTMNAAWSLVTQSEGDQILLAEGQSFNETIPWVAFKGGFSLLYPTVLSSYDSSDPTNESKYGRGDQRNARPKLTAGQPQMSNGTFANIAIKGLDFDPGDIANQAGAFFVGHASGILVENCIYRHCGFSYDSTDAQSTTPTAQHVIIRNNSFYGMWSNDGNIHTGGVYVAGVDKVTLEDNVFYRCGWRMGGNRSDDPSIGGPTIFNHSYYLQTNTTNAIVRRNFSADGSGDGGIARGDVDMSYNLFVDCPNAMGIGGGPDYNTDRPLGVNLQCYNNVAFGSDGVSPGHLLGWGVTTSNGLPGSATHDNLFVQNQIIDNGNASTLSNSASFNQPSYMNFYNNTAYLWTPSGQTYYAAGGAFPAQAIPFTTYNTNRWDDPASGTNINSHTLTFSNPYTSSTIYPALGYADKNAFVTYLINHPESHLQRTMRNTLSTGYA